MATGRSHNFNTPFGAFSYHILSVPRYAVGAILETAGKTPFLVASPEKALADKVWTDKRFSGLRSSDHDAYLSNDLRINRQTPRNPLLEVVDARQEPRLVQPRMVRSQISEGSDQPPRIIAI